MRSNSTRTVAALVAITLLSSCVALDPNERAALDRVRGAGLAVPKEAVVSPGAAGALNLLPGIGNMYLGSASEETGQWGVGIVNLLLWPVSVVWGIPEAAIDASRINEKHTAWYYMSPEGERELRRAERGRP